MTRRRLGGELKRLRDASGLKLEDVARTLECSPSKISRLENGKGIPKYRDVRDMLEVYGVRAGEQYEQLLEWSRTGQAPTWWREYADVLPAGLDTYVELEWDAARIQAYESHIVHGLLQTPAYARVVLHAAWSELYDAGQIERMVEVRSRRQKALEADHGLDFECVLDESTLYRMVGSAEIQRAQLERLIEFADADQVSVRILPFSAGLVSASRTPVAKLHYSEGIEQGLIYVERQDGVATFSSDPSEVAYHEARLSALLDVALSKEHSVPLLERAVRRLAEPSGPVGGLNTS